MHLALETGPALVSAAGRRNWRGAALATTLHVAVALVWLSWPATPPPDLQAPVVELVLAPPPPPPAAVEPPTPAPMAAPAPMRPPRAVTPKPVAAKPAPIPADNAAITESTPPPAAAAPPAPAPAPAPVPVAAAEPDLKPAATETPRPNYPRAARQRGLQGVVTVLVRVAEDGLPLEVAIKASSGHAMLDEAAVEAVRRWRFSPARLGGRAVAAAVEVPVRFALES